MSRVTKAEEEEIEKAAEAAAKAVELLISEGVQTAMNRYNKVKKPKQQAGEPGAVGQKAEVETNGGQTAGERA